MSILLGDGKGYFGTAANFDVMWWWSSMGSPSSVAVVVLSLVGSPGLSAANWETFNFRNESVLLNNCTTQTAAIGAVQRSPGIFSTKKAKGGKYNEKIVDELYKQIGKLKV